MTEQTDADLAADRWYESTTRRFRTPEATVFMTIVREEGEIYMVFVSAGKAGGVLGAQAEGMARLAGAACRSGADPERLGSIISGIGHERSNGSHWEAKSVVDALGKALQE